MAAAVCPSPLPAGTPSNPPSPMSWDAAPASEQPRIQLLSHPSPLLAPPRFSAVPPPHALPRPKPLYPSSTTLSGSESWSLKSVPSIEPPQTPPAKNIPTPRWAKHAQQQPCSSAAAPLRAPPTLAPHSLGRAMATARRLPLQPRKAPARRDMGVIGRMQAVDNLRAHSELCHTPPTRNNHFGSTSAVTANDLSRECRSYTFQDLSLWDQDEFEDCGFVPTSLRDFRNGYGADEWSKRPPARKRRSMRQLIRNQGHKSNAKLRWLRGQDSFDTEFECPPRSAGPISWGRALPRLFPRIRRR
jgi:hypothetical protein